MKIRGILFDKDGTLFDYHQTWMPLNHRAALLAARENQVLANQLLESGGWNPETGRVKSGSLIAAANNHEIAEEWSKQVGGWEIEQLAEKINELFTIEGVDSAVPVTDLPVLLGHLARQGCKLGVATSDSERGARAMLDRFDAIPLLDFVCGYDSGFGVKPAPGMVHGFCEAVELNPDQVIMVGDNWHDIEMGRNAGCALTVGVETGTSLREDLEGLADHVFGTIDELPDLLDRLQAV